MSQRYGQSGNAYERYPVDMHKIIPGASEQFSFLRTDDQNVDEAIFGKEILPDGTSLLTLDFDYQADDRMVEMVMRGLTGYPSVSIQNTLEGLARLTNRRSILSQRIFSNFPRLEEDYEMLLRSNFQNIADCLETGDYMARTTEYRTLIKEKDITEIVKNQFLEHSQDQGLLIKAMKKASIEPPNSLRRMRRGSKQQAQDLMDAFLIGLSSEEYNKLQTKYVKLQYEKVKVQARGSDAEPQTRYTERIEGEHENYLRTTKEGVEADNPVEVSYRISDKRFLIQPQISWRIGDDDSSQLLFDSDTYEAETSTHVHRDSLFGAITLAFLAKPSGNWALDLGAKQIVNDYAGVLSPLVVLNYQSELLDKLAPLTE